MQGNEHSQEEENEDQEAVIDSSDDESNDETVFENEGPKQEQQKNQPEWRKGKYTHMQKTIKKFEYLLNPQMKEMIHKSEESLVGVLDRLLEESLAVPLSKIFLIQLLEKGTIRLEIAY